MNMNMEVDPLSNYEYPYDYNAHPNINPYGLHAVKQEQPMFGHEFLGHFMDVSYKNNDRLYPNIPNAQQYQERQYTDLHPVTNENNGNINNENANNDVQNPTVPKEEDIKPIIDPKKIKKEKGRKSSYFSEKILDNNFKFYGCSVCDISFSALHELDQHVTTHKDRITSYDLKIKNQIKRKNMKKEMKKKKKMQKDVKIENEFQIEIKPEDGYIGNEKASDFNANQNNRDTTENANITNENNINTPNENNVNATNNGNTTSNIENINNGSSVNNRNASTDNGKATNVESDSKKDWYWT